MYKKYIYKNCLSIRSHVYRKYYIILIRWKCAWNARAKESLVEWVRIRKYRKNSTPLDRGLFKKKIIMCIIQNVTSKQFFLYNNFKFFLYIYLN